MNLNYFVCIGAELKRYKKDFDLMNQVYLYKLSTGETYSQVSTPGFFNSIADSIQNGDILYIYNENEKLNELHKFIIDEDNISIEKLTTLSSTISVDDSEFPVEYQGSDLQEILEKIVVGVVNSFDHNNLINRDSESQHPAASIDFDNLGTPEDLQTKLEGHDSVIASFSSHIDNTSNPHSVTKDQVGLGNVDNTSDLNKPISIATQNALDLKQVGNPGVDITTPISVSFNNTTRVLTVTPTGASFNYFTDGGGTLVKHTVVGPVNFPAITNTSGVWYFYFDGSENPISTQTEWTDFDTIAMIYRLYWNTNTQTATIIGYEVHPNTASGIDHDWKHTQGSIWKSGLNLVANPITSGSPNASGLNTCVSMTSGTIIDDNLKYTITNSTGGQSWQQDMGETNAANITSSNAGLFRVPHVDNGQFVKSIATRFPFLWNPTTNYPQTVINGVKTDVPNNYYFIMYVWVVQDPRNGEAVVVDDYSNTFSTLNEAVSVSWTSMLSQNPLLGDNEIRPLYKLIYEVKSTYGSEVKYAALRRVDDIRKQPVTLVSALGTTLSSLVIPIATCTTAAATAAKTITISGLSIVSGANIEVIFSNGNSADSPTLNVNATTNDPIYDEGGTVVSATNPAYFPVGAKIRLYRDSTNTHWVYVNSIISSIKIASGTNYANYYNEKYSNGFIRQRAKTVIGTIPATSSVTKSITLPVSMKDTIYHTHPMSPTNNVTKFADTGIIYDNKTTTSFDIVAYNTSTGSSGSIETNWEVSGYMA